MEAGIMVALGFEGFVASHDNIFSYVIQIRLIASFMIYNINDLR